MSVDVRLLERRFDEFNGVMFGGRLPRVAIRLTDARTFLGKCVYRVRRLPDGRREAYGFELRISTHRELPARVLEDVLIHEMIHYFILVNGLQDTSAHGRIFKALMASINDTYGRNIAISHKAEAVGSAPKAVRRRRKVIAVVELTDGRRLVKVLPDAQPKVAAYCGRLRAMAQVRGVEVYVHDNPFFDRFPTSTSLRMAQVDDVVLREALSGAVRVVVG